MRELRTVYRVTPEEQQVLARVHERLAQYSYPLPVHEPIQMEEYARPLQLVSEVAAHSHHSQPIRTEKRWVWHLSAIAGILFLVLLVGSLVLTFSVGHHSSVGSVGIRTSGGSDMRILLVPVKSFSMFSRQQMQTEATILSHRFSNFGLHGSNVHIQMMHGERGLMVDLPHFGNNEQ